MAEIKVAATATTTPIPTPHTQIIDRPFPLRAFPRRPLILLKQPELEIIAPLKKLSPTWLVVERTSSQR